MPARIRDMVGTSQAAYAAGTGGPPRWAALLVLAVAALGAALIARSAYQASLEAFETDARIAHRVLSQRAVQHDAILATLALLNPGPGADAADALPRLPALYPQVLRAVRRDALTPWPAELQDELAAAEAQSRAQQRAVAQAQELPQGRYWLVQAVGPAPGAAFALQIDARALMVAGEWPLAADSPVRAQLVSEGLAFELQAGRSASGPGAHRFAKALASPSQGFELQVSAQPGWGLWPWGRLAAWLAAVALAWAGWRAWQQQRAGARRAQELLRLGQVGRLNALGELAAGIAHELNQPLTAVMANTAAAGRLLADDEPDLPAARTAMDQATQQARRAAGVLSRLRQLIANSGAAGTATAVQPLQPIHPLMAGALDLLQGECQRLGVQVALDCQPPGLAVQADAVALEQIVHNLLGNALQALEQVPAAERRLRVGARAEGAQAVLEVEDSGPGIAPEVLPRLFEPFFTTRAGGLGLGLSLCETLAHGMGGTLQAAHATPRGARFTLRLPLQPAEGAPA